MPHAPDLDPAEFTPEALIARDARLYINCRACRVLRPADPSALCVAGRGAQPIGAMRFRCTTCARLGRPTETSVLVCWWAAGVDYTYDYGLGALTRGVAP